MKLRLEPFLALAIAKLFHKSVEEIFDVEDVASYPQTGFWEVLAVSLAIAGTIVFNKLGNLLLVQN